MKRIMTALLLMTLWSFGLATPSWSQDEWSKKAGLGPYAPPSYDEKQLYEKAKAEKEVTVYSYSSRVHQFGKTFEKQFPGIQVKGFDMDSTEIVTKILAEQKAGIYAADIIFLKDLATVQHELLEKRYVVTYVPPDLKSVLPERFQEPFLTHHVSLDVLVYNTEVNKQSPIRSLWDLTQPGWKSKVLFSDPSKMPEFIEFTS
jgi:iron(III) transport system substrate-binding protein